VTKISLAFRGTPDTTSPNSMVSRNPV